MQAQSYRRRRKAREPLPDTTPKMAAIWGETIFCALLPGVVCVPCVTANMAGKILMFSDVYGLAETYYGAWKSGKVGGCCTHENCFSERLLFSSEGLSLHYRIQHSRSRSCLWR